MTNMIRLVDCILGLCIEVKCDDLTLAVSVFDQYVTFCGWQTGVLGHV